MADIQNGNSKKIALLTLIDNKRLETDGTATPKPIDVDLGPIAKAGPMIEQMRVHFEGKDLSANFRVKYSMAWSLSKKTWSTDFDVLSEQSADGQVIGSYYTTATNFGLLLRGYLKVYNSTGAAIESGRVTAVLEVQFKS